MDEQTSPEIVPSTPPAGEANTAVPVSEPTKTETLTVEPIKETLPETPAEPLPAPEIAPEIAPTEPITETGTAQMAGNEPMTPPSVEETSTPEPESQATTEPTSEIPSEEVTAQSEPTPAVSQGSSAPEPQPTQQGSAQPELIPEPAPAQTIVTPPRNIARLLLEKAKATIQLRKQKKLLKIMTLFEKKSHITNDEVEKLLHVSDATATRYLSELEKQGRILQSGKTGHAVSYTKR